MPGNAKQGHLDRRAIVLNVDVSERPARMTILFVGTVGQPNRTITIRIRRDVTDYQEACAAAFAEFDAFTPEELALLDESATLAAPQDHA